jgi:hypothetical protein
MNGEAKLNEFLQAIEDWKSCRYLAEVEPPEDVSEILNANYSEMQSWTAEQCSIYAFRLYAYAEYIECQLVKENITLEWADSSIWYIISTAMQNYGSQYTKWQEKYYAAIKENPLASDILKIKNHAEARTKTLEGKNNRITKMAEILTSMARRKI